MCLLVVIALFGGRNELLCCQNFCHAFMMLSCVPNFTTFVPSDFHSQILQLKV